MQAEKHPCSALLWFSSQHLCLRDREELAPALEITEGPLPWKFAEFFPPTRTLIWLHEGQLGMGEGGEQGSFPLAWSHATDCVYSSSGLLRPKFYFKVLGPRSTSCSGSKS